MEKRDVSSVEETGCCVKFNPEPWDGQEHHWEDRIFLSRPVRTIFHMPINFGQVMTSMVKTLEDAKIDVSKSCLCLSDDKSLWRMDLLLETGQDLPNENMVHLSGTFVSKVFEGPYKNMRSWIAEMEKYVADQGKKAEKLYFWYTTCPGCAKTYGKNFVVIFAKV